MGQSEIRLTRADSPELTRRVILGLADRLQQAQEQGVGCRYCVARSLLREVRSYFQQIDHPAKGHAELLRRTEQFAASIRSVLASEPGDTTCRQCRAVRSRARAHWSATGPCSVHARCQEHQQ